MKKVFRIPVSWATNGFIEVEKTKDINSIQKVMDYVGNELYQSKFSAYPRNSKKKILLVGEKLNIIPKLEERRELA